MTAVDVAACDHGEPRGARYCALCRAAGQANRDLGESRALSAADSGWRDRADAAIRYLAHLGEPFTSEDVVSRAGLPSGDTGINANNAVGALMSAWAKSGRIRRAGYTASSRPSSHGATIALWEAM